MSDQTRIDLAIDALISSNAAEALGHLMLYKVEQIEVVKTKPPIRLERKPAFQDDLPPIIPLRDGIRVTAPSMQCPLCKAKPGTPCVKISSRGLPGVEMGEPLAGGAYHTARLQRAKEASS